MKSAYSIILSAHIVFGFVGLLTYWIPAFARKGSPLHVNAGRLFAIAMLIVSISSFGAALLSIASPLVIHPDRDAARTVAFAEFLFFLGLLTLSTTWNGIRFIRAKRDLSRLRAPLDILLNALTAIGGGALVVAGSASLDPVRMGFGGLGLGIGISRVMWLMRKAPTAGGRDYLVGHAGAMIGSGIAVHTAFLAGGAAFRYFPKLLELGPTFLLVPTIIGFAARRIVTKRYATREIGDAAPPDSRVSDRRANAVG